MVTMSDLPLQQTEQLPQPNSTVHNITPMRAGSIGAALGLGVGLLFGEFLVAGAVIAAASVVGMAALRSQIAKAAKSS
jgi:hypothetical protein